MYDIFQAAYWSRLFFSYLNLSFSLSFSILLPFPHSLSLYLSIYLPFSTSISLPLSSSLFSLSLSCTSLNFNLSASLKQPMKNFLSLRGKCPTALMPVYLKKAQGIDESYSIPNFYIILFLINLFTSILILGISGLLPKGRNTRLYTLNS